jgi:hypothetical protein
MRKLTTIIYLTVAALLGNVEVSASADFKTGVAVTRVYDYVTALLEFQPLDKQVDTMFSSL